MSDIAIEISNIFHKKIQLVVTNQKFNRKAKNAKHSFFS